MKNKRKHYAFKLFTLICVIIVISIGWLLYHPFGSAVGSQYIIIEQGEGVHDIANDLRRKNIISSVQVFVLGAKVYGIYHKINAGVYVVDHPMSMAEIYRLITSKNWQKNYFVIKDGMTYKTMQIGLESITLIKHQLNFESAVLTKLQINSPNMEGWFYPDNYMLVPGQTDLSLLAQAHDMMVNQLDIVWKSRNKSTVYKNKYELLIMASLIQKEASQYSDMQKVSTVFNNRLRIKMSLQDDPAVFYGLGNPRDVYRSDFKKYTPYNTYMNKGLPPTPICMPSKMSLLAAANPSDDKTLLYFVALPNGNILYAKDYKTHKQNASEYFRQKNKSKHTKKVN